MKTVVACLRLLVEVFLVACLRLQSGETKHTLFSLRASRQKMRGAICCRTAWSRALLELSRPLSWPNSGFGVWEFWSLLDNVSVSDRLLTASPVLAIPVWAVPVSGFGT